MQRITGLPDEQVAAFEVQIEAVVRAALAQVMDTIARRIEASMPTVASSNVEHKERVLVGSLPFGGNGFGIPIGPRGTLVGAVEDVPPDVPPDVPGQPYVSPDDLASIPPLWQEAVAEQVLPIAAQVFLSSVGKVHADMIDASSIAGLPSVGSLAAEQYLAQASNTFDQIGDHLWATARQQLSEGFEAGESIPQLAERLRASAEVTARTGVLVARTQVIEASNAGSFAVAQASGLQMKKEWIATPDLRTRPTHLAADGQRVDLNEPFIVGGFSAMFPAVSTLPPSERYSCRCTVGYVMPDKAPSQVRAQDALDQQIQDLPGTSGIDDIAAQQSARLKAIIDQQHADVEAAIEDVHWRFGERFPKAAGPGGPGPLLPEPIPDPRSIRPVYAQAKTPARLAEAWRDEMRRITGRDVTVNLPIGYDSSMLTLRQHAEGVTQMLEVFPEANLRRVSWFFDPNSADYAHVMAPGVIEFNAHWTTVAQRAKYLRSLRKDAAGWDEPGGTSWSTRGATTPTAVAYHEMAHIVDLETIGGVGIRDRAWGAAYDLAGRDNRAAYDLIRHEVSAYATSNSTELVAEAVTDVMVNGAAASQLSRDIFDLLRQEYRARGFGLRTGPAGEVFPKVAGPRPQTVAQLRAELKARGVTVPAPDARKADLQRMLEERSTVPGAPASAVGPLSLAERAKTGVVDLEPLPGGKNATVQLATFEDGTQAVKKTARTVEGRSAKLQQDAEEIEAKLLQAFGIRAPETVRVGPRVIFQERIAGTVADDLPRVPGSHDVAGDYYESDEGRVIGLVDALTDNYDRNAGNWIVMPDGHLAGIDHGFAFQWKPGRVAEAPFSDSNPFNRHLSSQAVGHKGEWVANDYSPADMASARQILESMRPEFERLDHVDWYDRAVERLGYIEQHATGTAIRIAPRVVRELPPPPPSLSRAPLAIQARQDALRADAARPVISDEQVYGGESAYVRRLEHDGGPPTITKDTMRTHQTKTQGARDADAEELGSLTADAVGLRAPTVIRVGPTKVEMEVIEGKAGGGSIAEIPRGTVFEETDDGRLMGLLDYLTGNPDRSDRNWFLMPDGHMASIDMGDAFRAPKLAGTRDNFGAGLMLDEDGKYRKIIDIAPADLAVIRARLEALRPEFERLGRATWHRQVMARLAEVEKRADPDAAIRLAEAVLDRATQRAAVKAKAAVIATQRGNAALIARVEELVQAKASKAVIRQELDPALREAEQLYAGADKAVGDALRTAVDSGDAAKIRAALTRQSKASGLTPIGKAGAKAKFDPATMEGVGGTAIPDGADVIVVRRGAKLAGIDTPERAIVRLAPTKALPPLRPGAKLTVPQFDARIRAARVGDDALASPSMAMDSPTFEALPAAQRRALAEYRGAGFEEFNTELRGRGVGLMYGQGPRDIIERHVRQLDDVFDASRLSDDVVLYRAPGPGREIFGDPDTWGSDLAGFTWRDDAYSSATVSERVAGQFGVDGGVRLRIFTPRGTKAVKMSDLTEGPDVKIHEEGEIVLGRGASYRVVRDRGWVDVASRNPVTGAPRTIRVRDLDVEVTVPDVTPEIPWLVRPASTAKTVAKGDFTGLTRTGEQMGGNPGGIFEAGDGSRWYVKAAAGDAQARSEALALDLYRAAGLDAPELVIGQGVEGLGRRQIATRFLDDAQVDLRARVVGDPAYLAEVQDGFATDAWLANWDVVGANPAPGKGWDNIVSVGGRPVRIEAGGALRFRGLGGSKPFGDTVAEFDTMRDFRVAARTSQVFDSMTPEQLIASAERVRKVTPAKIKALVKKHGLDPDLADTLIARREDILRRAEALAGPRPMTVREYNAAIKAAAKGQAALDVTPLPDPTAAVVHAYRSTDFQPINDVLRLKPDEEATDYGRTVVQFGQRQVSRLDKVFDQSHLSADVELWRAPGSGRGIFGDPATWGDDLAGFEWSDSAYSSTSASKRVADRFTKDGGVRLRVLAPKGSKAIQLSELDPFEGEVGIMYASEAEVLLARGARYRVVRDRGWTEITHPTTHQTIRVRDLDVAVVVPDETPPLPWATTAKKVEALPDRHGALGPIFDRAASGDKVKADVAAVLDGKIGKYTVTVTKVNFGEGDLTDALIVRGVIKTADGKQVGKFLRDYRRDDHGDLVAHHDFIQISRAHQGQGFAQEFNDKLLAWYRSSGVKRVELTANVDIGGYAWASTGYDFANAQAAALIADRLEGAMVGFRLNYFKPAEVARLFRGASQAQIQSMMEDAEALLARLGSTSFGQPGYPTAYEISQIGRWAGAGKDDMWLGKYILLESQWDAVLPLA